MRGEAIRRRFRAYSKEYADWPRPLNVYAGWQEGGRPICLKPAACSRQWIRTWREMGRGQMRMIGHATAEIEARLNFVTAAGPERRAQRVFS